MMPNLMMVRVVLRLGVHVLWLSVNVLRLSLNVLWLSDISWLHGLDVSWLNGLDQSWLDGLDQLWLSDSFLGDDGVEAMDIISGVVYDSAGSIGFDQRVLSLDNISITSLVLVLKISGVGIMDII